MIMKKKALTALGAFLVVTLVVIVCVVRRSYKPVSFVVDGEVHTGTIYFQTSKDISSD